MLAQHSKGALFIGTGNGHSYDAENRYCNSFLIHDFWKFSFTTNEWEKLGDGIFHPIILHYTELMDAYSDHLGCESKKKKIRMNLIFLVNYLEHKLKLNSPIFKTRKNNEDKREKQVKLG